MKSLKLICLILCVAILCAFATACGDDNSTDSGKKPDESSLVTGSSDKNNSDTASTDAESSNIQGTVSSDTDSSGSDASSQTDNSSGNTNTSSEQNSTASTPNESTALTVYVEYTRDGDNVTAEVKVKNNPGLTAFNFSLLYNKEALNPTKVTKGLVSVTSNLQQSQNLSGKVTLLYIDAEGFSDNGTLVTVSFDLKDAGKPFDLLLNTTQNSFLMLDGKTYVTDFVVK